VGAVALKNEKLWPLSVDFHNRNPPQVALSREGLVNK